MGIPSGVLARSGAVYGGGCRPGYYRDRLVRILDIRIRGHCHHIYHVGRNVVGCLHRCDAVCFYVGWCPGSTSPGYVGGGMDARFD